MEVNILEYRLRVASFPRTKGAIAKFTHALLDILFLRNARLKTDNRFSCITETNEDYSIICEESCLPLLQECDQGELSIVGDVWIPLVVSVGAMGVTKAGIGKIAKTVIIPLADFGVSVYCISTYKTDYILVRESDLQRACEILANDFKITKEHSLESEEVQIDVLNIPARRSHDRPREITHRYSSPNNVFHITSMDPERISENALAIIDCLFYSYNVRKPNENQAAFFSISIVDQDISLVLDSCLLERFPPHVLYGTNESWRMITIGDMPQGLGFVTPGVVAQMADPIASAEITEYYISSYYYGHTLVPLEDFSLVMEVLAARRSLSNESQNCNGTNHHEETGS